MPYDWIKSAGRVMMAMSGNVKQLDRVPFFALIDEQFISRIMGITTREILSSPETYANCIIKTAEFIQADTIQIPSAYAGPAEAYAFAEANNKMDSIHWYDYKPIAIKQGEVCKTEEDIEKLEIPDHSKVDLWETTFTAANIIKEKLKYPQSLGVSIWSVVQELRGVDAFKDIRRNPDLLLKLCEKIYESQLDVYNNWVEKVGSTPLIMYTGYAFNKHMMSFKDAMKYEGQFIKRFQEKIKAPFILHNCGTKPYFKEICREIDFIAVNGSHPLDIEYWTEFQNEFPKVTIMGANIDVSREMLTGTPQDVEEKVRENIINLAPGGRYIVSPICCLPWGVPLQNVFAIHKAIEKYGQYPIKTS